MTRKDIIKSLIEASNSNNKARSATVKKESLRNQINRTLRSVSSLIEASAKDDETKNDKKDKKSGFVPFKKGDKKKKEEESSSEFMSAPALKFLAKNFLKFDLKMDKDTGGYIPSREVLMSRERNRQKSLVDVLGKELWGDNYASENDSSKSFYASYRENRDKDVWEAQMAAFTHLVKKKLNMVVKGRATFFDQKAVKNMGDAYDAYIKILAAKGSKDAKKALGEDED